MHIKLILFAILDQYADWEAAYLAAYLNDPNDFAGKRGYAVRTVSLSKQPISSQGGFTVLPDFAISDVPDDFSGLVLIGGRSWRKPEAQVISKLVEKALTIDVPIGAICDGVTFLAGTGALNSVKHTGNGLQVLQNYAKNRYTGSHNYRNVQAVSDNKIVTANGTAALEFAKLYLESLGDLPQQDIDVSIDFNRLGFYEAIKRHHPDEPGNDLPD